MLFEKVRPDRWWNTWDAVYPAEMIHLPSGTHVALTAYSDAAASFTRLPPGHRHGVKLGPRTLSPDHIELEVEHGGTRLAVTMARRADGAITIGWKTLKHGEWGLRFWLNVCLWREDGSEVSYDPETTEMFVCTGDGDVLVKGPRFPLMATFHDDLDALKAEYEAKGYFYLASRGTAGKLGVLRYNLEEMKDFQVAFAWAPTRKEAAAKADAALAEGTAPAMPPAHTGHLAGALDAVRDCVAWTTVWDRANDRPYTELSRNWVAQKFGGWGVWLNDVVYHGLMAGLFDKDVAHDNQRAVFEGATEWGNFPCLLTGNDSWVDRSQPPMIGFATWMQHLRHNDRRFLEEGWPVLEANHEWWWRERDGNNNGILEYGTSPVGDGLYRGTKLAAKDESMMDNSPIHDEAVLVEAAHTMDIEDIALNSFVALDGEVLALMAAELGLADKARRMAERSDALKARIRDHLWDPDRRIFANRLWSGKFADSLAPTSFFALACGAATPEQAKDLVERHLLNEEEFWGRWVAPACTRNDPAFADNVYWRGRIWPPLNFMTYQGLRRYGFDDVAAEFARRCHELFMLNWAEDRICGENFSATTGRADDQPDTDLFYTWGALLAYVAVAETTDVTPWQGWTLNNTGADVFLDGFLSAAGNASLKVQDATLTVSAAGKTLLETTARGRLTHTVLTGTTRAVTLPRQEKATSIAFPDLDPARITRVTLDGHPLETAPAIPLPKGATGRLIVTLNP